jgi:hypothetical protein
MSFLRRSHRTQDTPVQGSTSQGGITGEHRHEGFVSRLLSGHSSTHQSHGIGQTQDPIVERKSRGHLFRSSRNEPASTNPLSEIKEAIAPHNQQHQGIAPHSQQHEASAGDKIHGLGSKIAGRLSDSPGQEAAGERMMKGKNHRSNRLRRLVGMRET